MLHLWEGPQGITVVTNVTATADTEIGAAGTNTGETTVGHIIHNGQPFGP
jgi:hypothetical protein